jgi:hypothetical protein
MRAIKRAADPAGDKRLRELFSEYQPGELDGYVMTPRGAVGVVIVDDHLAPPRPLWHTLAAVASGSVAGVLIGAALFLLIATAVLSGTVPQ